MEILKGKLGFKGNKGDTGEIGTPVPYDGTFDDLKNSNSSKYYNYIILSDSDTKYKGHWVYYDRKTSEWKDGGLYLSHYLTSEMKNCIIDQKILNEKYEEQIKNLANQEPQLPEIVDARNGFGTLGKVIKQKTYHFSNIDNMKTCISLMPGDVVQTLGYYIQDDGGGALYNITSNPPQNPEGAISLNNNLYAVLNENNVNVKMFGAQDSETIDQAPYIKNAIQYCFNKNLPSLELKGKFFIDSTMNFENNNNLKIYNGTFLVHETDELLDTDFNILYFKNCENISIDNIVAKELNPVQRTRTLYKGAIKFEGSKNCSISNSYFENLSTSIIFMNDCVNCNALNNVINTTFQSPQFAMSAILNYSSQNSLIDGNKIYGEYYDGVLSVFGGRSENVIVTNNELFNIIKGTTPTYLSQGITNDSGPKYTQISNNIIHDMYYGIDNKANTYYTRIENNKLIGCKFAITDRQGEATSTIHTIGTVIHNNTIVFQKDFDTDDTSLSNYLHYNKFYYVGISSSVRFQANIKNNSLYCYGVLDKPILAIEACQLQQNNQFLQTVDVSNNNIEFSTGILSTTSNAPSGSVGIVIKNVSKGKFNDNTFKVDDTSCIYTMFQFADTNSHLLISNNIAYGTNYNNHSFLLKMSDTSKIADSIISNNDLRFMKFDNLNSITNLVDYTKGIPVYRSSSISISTNWADAFQLYSQYANPIIIRLEGLASAAGVKIIDCAYEVVINGTTVTPIEIYNNNKNVDVQIVSTSTNGHAKVQIKSTIEYSSFVDVREFRPFHDHSQCLKDL